MRNRLIPPPSKTFVRISPKASVSAKFDLSDSYSINKPGKYSVSVDLKSLYFYMSSDSIAKENSRIHPLTSPAVTFTILKVANIRLTSGERQRMKEKTRPVHESRKQEANGPKDPLVIVAGASSEQEKHYKLIFKEIHRASYYYAEASALEVMKNTSRFITWFGNELSNRQTVIRDYNNIKNHLETKTVFYVVFTSAASECEDGTLGFTCKGCTTIFFCSLALKFNNLATTDSNLYSILTILVHEQTHAINMLSDILPYGQKAARERAKNDPSKAIKCPENYAYFSITTYPFNYGIDAMNVVPNKRFYIVKANFYARLTDDFQLDTSYAYPALLTGNWGNLPEEFMHRFDSMFVCKTESTYVTSGGKYIAYTDDKATKIGTGYPRTIAGNFGSVSKQFLNGIDSGSHLPNGVTYLTSGNEYVLYKDDYCTTVEAVKKIEGNWGKLPSAFNDGFDSMASVNGKTYVTKGEQYVRYSDSSASVVDEGYPKDITGNFGEPRQ